ncbi:hypothetical protein B296_00054814 [Ensete ventricosum]|uniref:Uncharacterized protein n=1 Tax=Ensete ventricosum TaxID=4639 RepID=A0A426WWU6_ENSVE|nr:hypothetical protein B296_00054814 [Ensete ventricosum]
MRSCCIFAAKAVRRRGDQPWPAPMQDRSPMARPRPWPPQGGATGYGQGQPAREASDTRKGRQQLAGAATCRGDAYAEALLTGTVASIAVPARGAGCRTPTRGCRPRLALLPACAAALAARVASPKQSGCRWARATVACIVAIAATTALRGQQGLGHPF